MDYANILSRRAQELKPSGIRRFFDLASTMEGEEFASTFQNIAGSVSEVVKADSVKVKVVYAKADGTELASKEYTKK